MCLHHCPDTQSLEQGPAVKQLTRFICRVQPCCSLGQAKKVQLEAWLKALGQALCGYIDGGTQPSALAKPTGTNDDHQKEDCNH